LVFQDKNKATIEVLISISILILSVTHKPKKIEDFFFVEATRSSSKGFTDIFKVSERCFNVLN